MRLSIRRTERGAGLPTASFIIICLAGGSESGQTEQTPSIFLLLAASLLFLLIFCHFHPLLLIPSMILPPFSLSASNVLFLSSPYPLSSLFLCSVVLRILLLFFILLFLLYLLLFLLLSHQLTCSILLSHFCPVLSIYSICFAFISLVLSTLISTLQFSSSIFHLSRYHLSVTLDVFHFSSFYSNLSLHSLH